MHDPPIVGGVERVGNLHPDLGDSGDLQRSLFDQRIERPAFHEFHRDERQPGFRLADVVDDADMGMIQRRSGFGLRQEPLPASRIVRHFDRQELDRRLSVETCVLGEKHLTHPACAKLGGDAVVPDRLADHA